MLLGWQEQMSHCLNQSQTVGDRHINSCNTLDASSNHRGDAPQRILDHKLS